MRTSSALDRLTRVLAAATRVPDGEDIRGEDSRLAAWWFLQAELLGLPAFGLSMADRELQRLEEMDAAAPAAGSAQLIDAATIPGHVALAAAVRRIIGAGPAGGAVQAVRAVAIRNVGALGILGSAARELALHGFISLVIANSAPIVAPWGGTRPALGTNPIAAAAPRAGGPVVVDFSTSSLTVAELREARAKETALPAPGALDSAGEHTSDPVAAHALLPPSFHGSLSGFVVELLTGVALGRDWSRGRSALVLAIDPESFGTDPAETCEQFARTWVEAGGHLPSRFDALPASPEGAPETIPLAAEAYQILSRS